MVTEYVHGKYWHNSCRNNLVEMDTDISTIHRIALLYCKLLGARDCWRCSNLMQISSHQEV
jgi:hypothetical protein